MSKEPTILPLLNLVRVSKTYESPGGNSLQILKGVSVDVMPGEALAIVGPSGSGKSTLLQIMGTLDHATSGEVRLGDRELSCLDEAELAQVRNREIGFVFQSHYLLPHCSVIENVLVPTLAQKAPQLDSAESVASRAERLLKRVGLEGRFSHRPGELSGGERQRVAVVRALINKPKLLLADEPTGSLDHTMAEQLWELLLELNREEHVTLIVVTHARELARRMPRVLELKDGLLHPAAEVRGT